MNAIDETTLPAPDALPAQPGKPDASPVDCLVVGAGPAGLTTALYLARFHLNVLVIDNGRSRAGLIPRTHNCAGFPDGISGPELLGRMRAQAERFGARFHQAEVRGLARSEDLLDVQAGKDRFQAHSVLLATGVVDHRPTAISSVLHDAALAQGLLRYCPICDGFEVTDRKIAVVGTGEHGLKEAEFLRSYTADITLVSPGASHQFDQGHLARAAVAGIKLSDGPCLGFALAGDRIILHTPEGTQAFASIYPALGSRSNSALGKAAGARLSDDGCILVDRHQRTSVPGLYAAGDVVLGLDQISHAMGEGGVAATAIRNDLAARRPLRR